MNQEALDFSGLRFVQGDELTPAKVKEQKLITVLEQWATWCPPCRSSIPHINSLHQQYSKKGVAIIGVTNETDEKKIKKFIQDMGNKMTYRVAIDTDNVMGEWSERFSVKGIPHAFVIDTNNKVRFSGHPMTPDFQNCLEKLTSERANASSSSSTHAPDPREAAIKANALRAMTDQEINALQMKALIAQMQDAGISSKGCIEKSDLIARIRGIDL